MSFNGRLTASLKNIFNYLDLRNGGVYPQVAHDATVTAKTSNYTVTDSDLGGVFTNTGASGTVVLTLPSATGNAGKVLRVAVLAAQILRVDPSGSEKLYLNGSGVAGKYLNIANAIGNYADLYCDGTDWFVVGYSGVLTKES